MILAINYANDAYKKAQKLNTKSAYLNGASKVIEFSPSDISEEFKKNHSEILDKPRGNGYWIWKPYIIKEDLKKIKDGDYLIYTDSGATYVNKINWLLDAMKKEQTNIMVFEITQFEKFYSKRDAFILLDCDSGEYANTRQICGSYLILKKCVQTEEFVDNWLKGVCDKRIVTDLENQMGKPNYEGFIDHRHDQTVLSLISKKQEIKPFRDPSQFGNSKKGYTEGVIERSLYPQIFDSHRIGNITSSYISYRLHQCPAIEKVYNYINKIYKFKLKR